MEKPWRFYLWAIRANNLKKFVQLLKKYQIREVVAFPIEEFEVSEVCAILSTTKFYVEIRAQAENGRRMVYREELLGGMLHALIDVGRADASNTSQSTVADRLIRIEKAANVKIFAQSGAEIKDSQAIHALADEAAQKGIVPLPLE